MPWAYLYWLCSLFPEFELLRPGRIAIDGSSTVPEPGKGFRKPFHRLTASSHTTLYAGFSRVTPVDKGTLKQVIDATDVAKMDQCGTIEVHVIQASRGMI